MKILKKKHWTSPKLYWFYKKWRRGTECTSKFVECQYLKGENVNKLWQKLSNMSIKTGFDLKTTFVWEKKKRITINETTSIWCNVLWSAES